MMQECKHSMGTIKQGRKIQTLDDDMKASYSHRDGFSGNSFVAIYIYIYPGRKGEPLLMYENSSRS